MKELEYIKIARSLNNKLHNELLEHEFHFRGNIKSFSLISLSKEFPEVGFSGLKKEHIGLKRFYEVIQKEGYKARFLENGRDTREKELQAWIVLNAIKNNMQLTFDEEITFLTSELALTLKNDKTNKGRRVVNDLLGLDSDGTLVVIELKSDRAKKRLIEQITNFTSVIKQNSKFFKELVMLLTEEREWNGKIRGVVVWPDSERARKINWPNDIEEFTYQEKECTKGRTIVYDKQNEIIFKRK